MQYKMKWVGYIYLRIGAGVLIVKKFQVPHHNTKQRRKHTKYN
jgi:hypothetical protein